MLNFSGVGASHNKDMHNLFALPLIIYMVFTEPSISEKLSPHIKQITRLIGLSNENKSMLVARPSSPNCMSSQVTGYLDLGVNRKRVETSRVWFKDSGLLR